MKIRLGDIDIEARFEEDEPHVSPHTGAPLRSGTLSITTKGDDQHETVKRLTPDVILDGENARWRIVRLKSWSTRSGSNLREDHLQVESDENRIAETLSFGGLVLRPEKYRETHDGQRLRIDARVAIRDSPKQIEALRAILEENSTLEIVRQGVSPQPLTVLVKALGWSGTSNEYVFELRFTERRPAPVTPLSRLRDYSVTCDTPALVVEWLHSLSALLVGKGTITKHEAEEIMEKAEDLTPTRRLLFLQVDDVRQYPFPSD